MLEEATKKIGLKINTEKTKILEHVKSKENSIELEGLMYGELHNY